MTESKAVDLHHDDSSHSSLDTPAKQARVVYNPLHGISREELHSQVDALAREKGLEEHVHDLQKGARLAQNPLVLLEEKNSSVSELVNLAVAALKASTSSTKRTGRLFATRTRTSGQSRDFSVAFCDNMLNRCFVRRSHPKTLYVTIFLCSVGAATQGWDQTGSNGGELHDRIL